MKMAQVGLVVMCGLPGVGKSSLCENLRRISEDITCVHVNFDELIPPNVEKELIERANDESSWKEYRRFIKSLIGWKVSELINGESEESPERLSRVPKKLVETLNSIWPLNSTPSGSVVILVDDNMYYRSMRYEYFQLARQFRIGFGQVFFDVPLSEALKRNTQRQADKVVAKDVIETMATRIETPSSDEWEKYAFNINQDFENFPSLLEFFRQVLENPFEPVKEVDPELQEQSRIACSESITYQADQILRKLVSQHMVSLKGSLDKTALKKEGLKVNTVRTAIISDMKKQHILVENSIVENSVDAALNKCSPLYEFVKDLFVTRVK